MPCLECENGLWRFGESGKCQYQSFESCEAANADYYAETTEYDYTFNFTYEQMEELHENGQILVHIENDNQEMDILFTYNADKDDEEIEKEIYDNLTNSLLDDELDEYINKLTNSIKQL